jgi:hypothetical protein
MPQRSRLVLCMTVIPGNAASLPAYALNESHLGRSRIRQNSDARRRIPEFSRIRLRMQKLVRKIRLTASRRRQCFIGSPTPAAWR